MIATVLGVGLILVALRDIFETLFRPLGRGVISEAAVRAVWRGGRLLSSPARPGPLTLAGPIGFLSVIIVWVMMVTVGGALLIEPRLSDGYAFQETSGAAAYSGFVDAVSISLVNLTSLGFGDAVPTGTGMRILGPVQALIGLGLVTTTVSWILSIYRVITLTGTLGRDLHDNLVGPEFHRLGDQAQWTALMNFASRLTEVRGEIRHFPIAYFFRGADRDADLCMSLGSALATTRVLLEDSRSVEVQFYAARLCAAIEQTASEVDQEFLGGRADSAEAAIDLWRADHMRS